MRNTIIVLTSLLLISSCCTYDSSCFLVRAWDGAYSRERIMKRFEEEEKAFYDTESKEQKELRRKNREYCNKEADIIINDRIKRKDFNHYTEDPLVECMKRRGTPFYGIN